MKQILTTVFVLFIAFGAMAQSPNPYPRTIEVSGSAETEIIPDEIYVVVTLKEYEKKQVGKVGLEKIKSDFLGYCKAIGLPDSAISISSYEGHNPSWWRRRRSKDELFASISYQVKFNTSKKMDELVEKLDEDATQNFLIARVSHSKISEYRKQLKIQAVKAAKDKGGYLAESIGENLGVAVSIIEPEEVTTALPVYALSQTNVSYASRGNADEIIDNGVDFKKIKLRYEVKAVFALK